MLGSFQDARLMKIDTHKKVVERHCSENARKLMEIINGEQFHVSNENSMANPAILPKFMIVASASNSSTSIIQAGSDELQLLKDEVSIPMQCINLIAILQLILSVISHLSPATSKCTNIALLKSEMNFR